MTRRTTTALRIGISLGLLGLVLTQVDAGAIGAIVLVSSLPGLVFALSPHPNHSRCTRRSG